MIIKTKQSSCDLILEKYLKLSTRNRKSWRKN